MPLTDYMAAYVPKYTGRLQQPQAGRGGGRDRDDRRRRAVAVARRGAADDQRVRPAVGAPEAAARTPGGSIRGAYLSDPVTHPLAYHALSALMLTQVAERLSPAARRTLGETLETLNVLVAPDGAADYFGRGEGNVWVPAVTAAAMVEGAALYPERAGRYLAVAEAAVARLRALHLTPEPRPARRSRRARRLRGRRLVRAHRRLQRAGAVGARGRRRARRDAPTGRARRAAGGGIARGRRRPHRLAVVGTGRSWLAVRAVRRGANHDLRYGFGLLSLKVREGGGWRDLLAPRPLFEGRPITPAPLLGSRDPGGTRVDTSPGAIAIRGTYGRGGVDFGFRALPDGAELTHRAGPRRRALPAARVHARRHRRPRRRERAGQSAPAGGSTPRSRSGATAAGTGLGREPRRAARRGAAAREPADDPDQRPLTDSWSGAATAASALSARSAAAVVPRSGTSRSSQASANATSGQRRADQEHGRQRVDERVQEVVADRRRAARGPASGLMLTPPAKRARSPRRRSWQLVCSGGRRRSRRTARRRASRPSSGRTSRSRWRRRCRFGGA